MNGITVIPRKWNFSIIKRFRHTKSYVVNIPVGPNKIFAVSTLEGPEGCNYLKGGLKSFPILMRRRRRVRKQPKADASGR